MASLRELLNWESPNLLDKNSPMRHWLLLVNIILVNFIVVVEALGVALALDVIQGYMAVDSTKIAWLDTGFLLTLGIGVPLSIYFSRKYGFKRLFFIGIVIFSLGSLVSGFAENYVTILSARMVSGIGGGMIFPISLAIIKRVFKGNMLAVAVTVYVAVTFGIGLGVGCILGGHLAQAYAWRTLLFLGVYVGVPSLLFTWIIMNETGKYPTTKFDFVSFLFFCIFLSGALFYLTQVKAPWNTLGFRSYFSVFCALFTLVFLIVFIIRYNRVNAPLFALSIFKRKEFTISCIAMAFVGVMVFGSAVSVIELLIAGYSYQKNYAGEIVSIFGFMFGLGGLIPIVLGKWVKVHYFAVVGLLLVMVSCFMNHGLTLQSTPGDIIWILIFRALGTSMALGPLTAISLSSLPDDLTGQGAAIVTIFRQVGGAYGAAVISVITTLRTPFHLTRFAEMINPYSAAFQNYLTDLKLKALDTTGKADYYAEKFAEGYFVENLYIQAKIAAYDDAFYIFGWIFLVLGLMMLYLALSKKKKPELERAS